MLRDLSNIKCVILAGGLGTRISEETINKPKPMIEIGGHPIIWHIMKIYSHYGIKNFILCCGYKINNFKEYFINYNLFHNNFTINLKNQEIALDKNLTDDWNVSIVDTGKKTMTGGRLLRIKDYLKNDDNFFLTYGDGVSNINIDNLYDCHLKNDKIATLSAVSPSGRFGKLEINNNLVETFNEKQKGDIGRINGGFFVFQKKIFDYLENDETILEKDPLAQLSYEKQLTAYKHNGFWQCMDNLRDKEYLESLYNFGDPKWKIWKD